MVVVFYRCLVASGVFLRLVFYYVDPSLHNKDGCFMFRMTPAALRKFILSKPSVHLLNRSMCGMEAKCPGSFQLALETRV